MNPLEYLSIIVHCTIHHPLDLSGDDPACCTESSSSKITFYRFLLLTLHCQVKQVNFIHLSLTIGGTCYTIKSIVYKIWTNKNKVREKHIFHFYVQYFFKLLLVLATFSFSLFLFFFSFLFEYEPPEPPLYLTGVAICIQVVICIHGHLCFTKNIF